jgi:hypothetical protein
MRRTILYTKVTCNIALMIAFLAVVAAKANATKVAVLPTANPDRASICDAVAGNLVKNCGFETGDFSDWTVKFAPSPFGPTLEVASTLEGVVPHSGNFAALFGSFTTDDAISQVLSTTPGRAFDLSFFLENFGSITASITDFSASWDGKSVFNAPITAFPYTQFSFVVPGHGPDTLQFAGRGGGGAYVLDDVEVTPVPEPSTLSLFGLGLLLMGIIVHRKQLHVRDGLMFGAATRGICVSGIIDPLRPSTCGVVPTRYPRLLGPPKTLQE